ncbi:MAG TPA: phosphatase PAP2 family protein [Anaerolineae bacterium]|nr:phosphatase PAP2 family protein [Anaerolineae bacterium]
MEVFTWGIEFNVWLQTFSTPFLDALFKAITFMGNEEFYLILLPLVYWCFDKGIGVRLVFLYLLGAYINTGLKDLFGAPRPFQFAPERVRAIGDAKGYGFPSGHSQGSAMVWSYLATQVGRWFWIAGIGLPLLVGLSRMYLGVHFPGDVLGGWAIGAVCVALYVWLAPAAARWLRRTPLALKLALAIVIPLVLVAIHLNDDTVKAMAALMGLGAGIALEVQHVGFSARGGWWKRALRFLVGAVVLLALYLGLKLVFPGEEQVGPLVATVFRMLRYGLIGLWAGFVGPWAFVSLKLAEKEGP